MDDFTVGVAAHDVSADVKLIATKGAELGLNLNTDKCEPIYADHYSPKHANLN